MSDPICQGYISVIEKMHDPTYCFIVVLMFGSTLIILFFGYIHSCWCSYPGLRPIRLLYPDHEAYKQVPPTGQLSEYYLSPTGYPPLPDILSADMLEESDCDEGEMSICDPYKSEASSRADQLSPQRRNSLYSQGSKCFSNASTDNNNTHKNTNTNDHIEANRQVEVQEIELRKEALGQSGSIPSRTSQSIQPESHNYDHNQEPYNIVEQHV